jgi:hypothetical protein
MSRNPHEPSKESRQLVQLHATIGTPQAVIADILGIDGKTLTKYYREELDQALARANASVGGALFNKATKGDTAAMIFWMKTRAGWREKQEIDLTSSDGSMTPQALNLKNLSDTELEAMAKLMAKAQAQTKEQ